MFLGIDLGTSGVKAVLCDDAQAIVAQADAPLVVSRPHPAWSEQDPHAWWSAAQAAVAILRETAPAPLSATRAIGLSGQMHGATLLDDADRVLRPAILWNDGRSAAQCAEIEAREPRSREITGNLAMPGFTAPKVLWVRQNEPEVFARTARVLLPKDYLRLCMTGDHVSEMSDASGTLWLDVAARAWSDAMLETCGLDASHMPSLVEGSEASARLRPALADAWGMSGEVVVAGGAGDNAAGAAGVGAVEPGRAFVSLGTSGVYFLASARYAPNPGQAVHAFCHCLPDTWHQMSVILSAASCLGWVTRLVGAVDEAALLARVEAAGDAPAGVVFLPYLSGERTPHNDPQARGVFFGLDHDTDAATLGRAVLEGVAFAFADGQSALEAAGAEVGEVSVIGGGARSALWGRILASVLDRPLDYHAGAELGPAFGAARLARLAADREPPAEVCTRPAVSARIEPDAVLRDAYRERHARFQRLYHALRDSFASDP